MNKIIFGDCRDTMRDLIAQGVKVQMCVTSPPYFGLRDYGHPGQLGLEQTPDEYVAAMVEVFSLVWYLLADDGVLFLNLGDSYHHTNPSGPQGKNGARAARTFTAAGAGGQRAKPYDTFDKVPVGSQESDCLCGSLCDACRKAYRTGKSHNGFRPAPTPTPLPSATSREHMELLFAHLPTSGLMPPEGHNEAAIPDAVSSPIHAHGPLPSFAESTPSESFPQHQDECLQTGTPSACLLCEKPLTPDARQNERKTACTCGIESPSDSLGAGKKGRVFSDLAYLDSTTSSLKPKDLIGIPWRVAFALQAAGWYLRQDIIWHKPNPMPESVTDRCTKAHEYMFLLSKSERYYFDNEAIKEPAQADKGNAKSFRGGGSYTGGNSFINSATKERETHGNIPNGDGTRNRRSVWTIATTPYSGAHFATFPPALIEPCILAGSRTAGKRCDCDQLIESPTGSGAIEDPSAIVGRAGMSRPRRDGEGTRQITRLEQRHHAGEMKSSPHREEMAVICGPAFAHYIRTDTSGARPLPEQIRQDFMNRGWITYPAPCTCQSYPADVVFDPFMGSGTTAQVAIKLGRQYLGCELNPAYADLQNDRTAQDAFIF